MHPSWNPQPYPPYSTIHHASKYSIRSPFICLPCEGVFARSTWVISIHMHDLPNHPYLKNMKCNLKIPTNTNFHQSTLFLDVFFFHSSAFSTGASVPTFSSASTGFSSSLTTTSSLGTSAATSSGTSAFFGTSASGSGFGSGTAGADRI